LEDAAGARVATIERARISIVATRPLIPGHTNAGQAHIVERTIIAVVARLGVVGVLTTTHGFTSVGSTRIAIVAIQGLRARDALARAARVAQGAQVAIVALTGDVGIDTAGRRVALFGGAGIAVITVHRVPGAQPRLAFVRLRTWVSIVARGGVERVRAAGIRQAKVIGTLVPVVTSQRLAALLAEPVHAVVIKRTLVVV